MKENNKEIIMKVMYEEAKNMLIELSPKEIDLRKYFNIEKSFKTKNDILKFY